MKRIMGLIAVICMMLFVSTLAGSMGLVFTEENIGAAAKVTFLNVLLLTLLFRCGNRRDKICRTTEGIDLLRGLPVRGELPMFQRLLVGRVENWVVKESIYVRRGHGAHHLWGNYNQVYIRLKKKQVKTVKTH